MVTDQVGAPQQKIRVTVVVGTIVGVGAFIAALVVFGFPSSGPDQAKVLTVKGLERMIDDAQTERGTTQVVEASLFENHAIVEFPVDGGIRRTISYNYRGSFDDVFTKGSQGPDEPDTLVDLADLDVPATLALLKSAPADVGLPDGEVSSVTIRLGTGAELISAPSTYIRVNTEFDEYGTVQADMSGKVIKIDKATD